MYHVWMHLEGPEEAASHAYVTDVTELARDLHTRPQCSCVFFSAIHPVLGRMPLNISRAAGHNAASEMHAHF